jgi:hypothetical protein
MMHDIAGSSLFEPIRPHCSSFFKATLSFPFQYSLSIAQTHFPAIASKLDRQRIPDSLHFGMFSISFSRLWTIPGCVSTLFRP